MKARAKGKDWPVRIVPPEAEADARKSVAVTARQDETLRRLVSPEDVPVLFVSHD